MIPVSIYCYLIKYPANSTRYNFDDIIKIEDFDPDNILIDEKTYKNILDANIS